MAWIPMYLLSQDIGFLNDWLSQEKEIAFLISNGSKKWIAKKEYNILADIGIQKVEQHCDFAIRDYTEYNLWHIPSGELPLLGSNSNNADSKIDDPWLGWTEIKTGANERIPYFGAGHPGIINLEINLPRNNEIRMSNFGWIGNHYKIIGNGASASTECFWNKLRRMVKKNAAQISRANNPIGKKEIYAFPEAYKEIKNGRPCSLNP